MKRKYQRIVILTGTGISASCGIPTFRGTGGVMNEELVWASTVHNLPGSLPLLWKHYGAHTMLVNLEPTSPKHPDFAEEIIGETDQVLPGLLDNL